MDLRVLRRLISPLMFCALSVLIYLANSAPTPTELNTAANSPTNRVSGKPARKPLSQPWEEAREIWNGLRMVKKHYAAKRQAREADGPTSSPAPDYSDLNDLSIPIPAYMKELYWNISQHKTDDVETTTIRSLPARRTGNDCGFNFSIGDISEYEVFTRAELRIHMKQPDGSDFDPVFLQIYHGGHKGTYKRVTPNREGWIVFDVLGHLQRWRASGHPHKNIHFYIITYRSFNDLSKRENGTNCHNSTIKFDHATAPNTTEDIDLQPLLMIYSRDMDVVKFNVSAIIAAAEAQKSKGMQRRNTDSSSYSEVTEPTPTLGGCGKHSLEISIETFNTIWQLAQPTQTALYPTTLNIDVCGGDCNTDLPSFLTAQHSIILYYLHTRSHTTPYSNAEWSQCCAPVKYGSIEIMFALPDQIKIDTLRDITVKQCSCMSILRRTQSPTSSSSSR